MNRKGKTNIKTAVRIAAFFAGLAILLAVFSMIDIKLAKRQDTQGFITRSRALQEVEQQKPNTLDVLILGDSMVFNSVSPMQIWSDMGVTALVAGNTQELMPEAEELFNTALEKQDLKVVVLETGSLFNYVNLVGAVQNNGRQLAMKAVPLLRYHSLWKRAIDGPNMEEHTWWKGFHITSQVIGTDGSHYMDPMPGDVKIADIYKNMMKKIKERCDEEGIRLVLYSAPATVNYNSLKVRAAAELAEELGVDYLDMNTNWKEIGIDWQRDTCDAGDHLNILGAQKTTAGIEEYLKQLNLPDKRNDPEYTDWNELAEQYREACDKAVQEADAAA